MYEEGKKRLNINWGSLIIKLLILALVIFLACFIFSKITNHKKNNTNNTVANNNSNTTTNTTNDFTTNITTMKNVAFEYFTKSKLPEKVGSTEKLTLGEMLDKKLLIDFTDNGKVCSLDNSYIQATRTLEDNYALKVNLECGKKSDYILANIEKEKICVNNSCNNNTSNTVDNNKNNSSSNNNSNSNSNNNSNSNKNNNSSSNNSGKKTTTTTTTTTVTVKIKCINGCCNCCTTCDNNNNNTTKKVRYYEYVKWSSWSEGYSSDAKAENKKEDSTTYNYCKQYEKEYYTSGFKTSVNNLNSFTYDFYLNLPSDVKTVSVINSSYFGDSTSDYKAFINNRNNNLMGSNAGSQYIDINNASELRYHSLSRNNFTYSLGDAKQDSGQRDWMVPVTINYYNANGVKAYTSTKFGNMYFTPVKFSIKYTKESGCQRDLESNSNKYKGYAKLDANTTSKWMHRTLEYKWSKESSLEGFTKTGNYEDRNA